MLKKKNCIWDMWSNNKLCPSQQIKRLLKGCCKQSPLVEADGILPFAELLLGKKKSFFLLLGSKMASLPVGHAR